MLVHVVTSWFMILVVNFHDLAPANRSHDSLPLSRPEPLAPRLPGACALRLPAAALPQAAPGNRKVWAHPEAPTLKHDSPGLGLGGGGDRFPNYCAGSLDTSPG